MKKLLTILIAFFIGLTLNADQPQEISPVEYIELIHEVYVNLNDGEVNIRNWDPDHQIEFEAKFLAYLATFLND